MRIEKYKKSKLIEAILVRNKIRNPFYRNYWSAFCGVLVPFYKTTYSGGEIFKLFERKLGVLIYITFISFLVFLYHLNNKFVTFNIETIYCYWGASPN